MALALASCVARPSVPVTRFHAAIQLTPDGVAEVEETFVLPSGVAGTFVRHCSPETADAVAFVGASLDGAPAPAGAVTIEAAGDDGFRVTWQLAGGPGGEREVGLRYRASGVLAIRGGQGQFAWRVLPEDRGYAIGTARLVVTVPPGVARVGPWGIAEPGWQVAELPNGIAAGRELVGASEHATVLATLALAPGSLAEPRWQRAAELARELVPAFLSGGLFILVIGAGVIWIVRFEVVSRTGRRSGWRHAMPARTAEGLYAAGIACVLFGMALLAIAHLVRGRYGDWVLAIPASTLIVGGLFVLVGKRKGGDAPA